MYSFEKINKINWYKQSGAGILLCISMPTSAFPELYKKVGFYFPNDIVLAYQNKNGFIFNHYFDYDLSLKELKKIFLIIKNNSNFFKKLEKNFYIAGKQMEKIGLNILNQKIDSKDFSIKYKKFLSYTKSFWFNSLFIDLLDPFEEEILKFIFKEKIKEINKEDLNILLSPDKMSLFQQSQIEMLKIYDRAIIKGKDSLEIKKMISKISKKYYWQKNDYEEVFYLDEKYFEKQLENLFKNSKERKIIKINLLKFQETITQKKQIIKKYNLNKENIKHLNFFNWITSYREDRKKFNQISNYVLIKIIEKISQEKKIDLNLLKYLISDEVLSVIKKPKLILSDLKKRLEQGAIIFGFKNKNNKLFSGKVALDYLNILEKKINKVEIKGNTASTGKVIGNVKIILNQKDFSKMEVGDILVTSMTRPEFVPLMKKASGIITDEGGITCHAAIVSREFGIPCITGTQYATKILKDGDLVDVNANHGLVKIIKKKIN